MFFFYIKNLYMNIIYYLYIVLVVWYQQIISILSICLSSLLYVERIRHTQLYSIREANKSLNINL